MTKISDLEQRLREQENEKNDILLRIAHESGESLQRQLKSCLQSVRSSIEEDIQRANQQFSLSLRNLRIFSVRNTLLTTIAIFLGLTIGSASLSYYLSHRIRNQLELMNNNKFELASQQEALKSGHFFRNPEDKKLYVRIVKGSEYDARSGAHWAELDTE